jgi:exopolyphosphatase/guanosine-5'-triphosphate,3'-diphosphate pyrophosphatase
MRRIAIIDLGTNTFNLIIAEVLSGSKYTIIHSEKRAVKLGEGGINKGEISQTAFNRGLNTIEAYYTITQTLKVEQIIAFGTSALRTAANGADFINHIQKRTGIEVKTISGDKEAELIYLGVRQTLNIDEQKFLILDIGGGSNEFILADMHQIYWKKSYPLGIARLLEKFCPSDPITQYELTTITNYIENELHELFELLKSNNIKTLIGASGSFETFIHMLQESEVSETESETAPVSNEILLSQFESLHNKLIASTISDRKKMKGLESMRIEMIVLASLFVNILFTNHNFSNLYQSNFSMKEGAVYELLTLK